MSYATVADVSTRLGRPITDPLEVAQVQAWLGDVEALILAQIPNLAALIAAGSPTVAIVSAIEANAVIRKIRNPQGLVSETIDDYTYRRNDEARNGELFLTDAEWALLSPAAGGTGAFTIRPGGVKVNEGWWLHPDTWVPSP